MHSIEKTIAVINQLAEKGVIENYALGGATAVIFYTEPIATEDVDMKAASSNATAIRDEYIESQKASFRKQQRDLPFGEKMLISFALAERDATIRGAVLLPKKKKSSGKQL